MQVLYMCVCVCVCVCVLSVLLPGIKNVIQSMVHSVSCWLAL